MIDCYENCKDIRNGVCPPMKMFCPKQLAEHDSDLLDKVAEKMKAEVNVCKNCMIVDCDTEYFKPMCEKADKEFIVAEVEEIVDEVIAELKAEVREYANES